ncbi:MAG: hypothetical protein N838_28605 [Thiohalocapsa sp. PB-PSB1]|jgi:type II secretory pathway component PulJ|nr:MAG: hypothetical protein N838_02370 [Thiohalocapsa sp. PB-PSB1]QQO56737.1 MAG: hypothetical protein N838_28605 [Thiohalocapsa sp. PB-PSB1]
MVKKMIWQERCEVMEEGGRILWVHSTSKAQVEHDAREQRMVKAEQALEKTASGAAFKECKDSPQRRRGATAPRRQADLYQALEPVGVGARLRATQQMMMPADRARAPRLSRKKGTAFKQCKYSPQRHSVRRGAKANASVTALAAETIGIHPPPLAPLGKERAKTEAPQRTSPNFLSLSPSPGNGLQTIWTSPRTEINYEIREIEKDLTCISRIFAFFLVKKDEPLIVESSLGHNAARLTASR